MTEPAAATPVEASAPASVRTTSRGRTALAIVIFVIAALIGPTALVGAWASRTIDDTDRYVSTVTPLIDSPEVRAAISLQITDALFTNVPVNELLTEALPPRAQALNGPITSGLRSFVNSKVNDVLATPQAREAWATINSEFQSRLIAALKGDNSGAVRVEGDSVVLDTGVLFTKVQSLLVAQGFTIFAKVPLPAAADRQFVLLQSDQVKTVSTVYRVVQPLANALIWVFLALLVLGIYVSNRRRYGVMAAGWILIANGALLIGVVNVTRAAFLSELGVADQSWQGITFDTVTRYLDGLARTSLTLGIVAVVAAWLAGNSRPALAIRRGISKLVNAIAAPLARSVPALVRPGQIVDSASAVLGGVIVAIGAIALVWGRTASAGRIAWIVILGLIAWLIVLVLAAVGRSAPVEQPVAVDAGS